MQENHKYSLMNLYIMDSDMRSNLLLNYIKNYTCSQGSYFLSTFFLMYSFWGCPAKAVSSNIAPEYTPLPAVPPGPRVTFALHAASVVMPATQKKNKKKNHVSDSYSKKKKGVNTCVFFLFLFSFTVKCKDRKL